MQIHEALQIIIKIIILQIVVIQMITKSQINGNQETKLIIILGDQIIIPILIVVVIVGALMIHKIIIKHEI